MDMEDSLHLQEIEKTFKSGLAEATVLFQDRDVVIRVGKYRGRLARVTALNVSGRGTLGLLAQPYDTRPGKGDRLLWDDAQARTYRPADHLFLVPLEQRWYEVVPDPANPGAWQVQTPGGDLAFTTESCGPQKRSTADRVAATSNAELCRRMVNG